MSGRIRDGRREINSNRDATVEAHRYMEANSQFGKIVATI
jgi:hypothetical protein